jgi:hypothetical protein
LVLFQSGRQDRLVEGECHQIGEEDGKHDGGAPDPDDDEGRNGKKSELPVKDDDERPSRVTERKAQDPGRCHGEQDGAGRPATRS